MKVNDYYNAKKIIIYDNSNEYEKTLNPYTAKAFYNTTDILGEPYTGSDDYFIFKIEELTPANKNQVNKKKRENACFILLEPGTLEGTLYMPKSYIKEWTKEEERHEYKQGCVSVSYNDIITFNNDILEVRDSFHDFKKGTDPINQYYREDITPIDEEIANLKEKKPFFDNEKLKERRQRLLAFYESKKEAGAEYVVWCYRAIKKYTNVLHLSNCVDHYEKTPDFIKAEKITEELNAICDRWSVSNTLELLKTYKLTKKRQTKKGSK